MMMMMPLWVFGRMKISADERRARAHRPECMTCLMDSQCLYVTAQFSISGRYYIEGCLGPGVPRYTLKSTVGDAGKTEVFYCLF